MQGKNQIGFLAGISSVNTNGIISVNRKASPEVSYPVVIGYRMIQMLISLCLQEAFDRCDETPLVKLAKGLEIWNQLIPSSILPLLGETHWSKTSSKETD